jgi:hypothetical protein
VTGRGGDLIIIDDPLKPDDAYSEVKRNGANEWFKNTLISRLDDKRRGVILIVMQRIHMDDLTGFVQSLSDDWTVLSLPTIAEIDEDVPISEGRSIVAGRGRRSLQRPFRHSFLSAPDLYASRCGRSCCS